MSIESLEPLAQLIRWARKGDANAFGALCVQDNTGAPIQLAPIHRIINSFIDYCWSQDPPLYCGILAPWRHGKCQPSFAMVSLASGALVPIRAVRSGDEMMVVDPSTWEAKSAPVQASYQGWQPCVRLRTAMGRVLEVTEHHPLYTFARGWTPAGAVEPGEALAVYRAWPGAQGGGQEAALLGYLVGDGSTIGSPVFTTASPSLLRRVGQLCRPHGWALRRLSGLPYDYAIHRRLPNGTLDPKAEPPVVWLRRHGLLGRRSREKEVPVQVMEGGQQAWAAFLGAYFDCDGTVERDNLTYGSTSEGLLRQCQILLARLGLAARLRRVDSLYKGQPYTHWSLSLYGDSLRGFVDLIPLWHPGKRRRALALRRSTLTPKPSQDVIPNAWRHMLSGPCWDVTMPDGRRRSLNKMKWGNTREAVREVARQRGAEGLERLCDDRVLWDRVVSVAPLGYLQTYGVETPTETYLAGDIVTHNTKIGTIGRAAHVVGLNRNSRVRLVCADDREAVLRVADVRRIIESARYRRVFPKVVAQHGEWLKHQFTVQRPGGGPDPSVSAAGVFSAEAGGGHDYMMFDDIVDYQNCFLKPSQREEVFNSLTAVWLRRIDPGTRVLLVGTAWHYNDCYHRLRRGEAGEGQWRWLIIRVSPTFNSLSCTVE